MTAVTRAFRKALGPLIFLLLASLLGFLWLWERKRAELHTQEVVSHYADEAVSRIGTFLSTRMALLRSFHHLLRTAGYRGDSLFIQEASILYHAVAGYQAINWIDRSGRIAVIYPYVGNEPALGFDLHQHPDAGPTFRRAEETGQVCMTPTIRLLQGGPGLATYWPVDDSSGRRIGYLNGVFDLRGVFREALHGLTGINDVRVQVFVDTAVVYDNFRHSKVAGQPVVRLVRFGPNEWTVRLIPGPGMRETHGATAANSWLLAGLALVAAVACLVHVLDRRQESYRWARDQARRSETRLRSIVEASPQRIYAIDKDFRLLFESPSGESITGYRSSDWPEGRFDPSLYVDPHYLPVVREGIENALQGRTCTSSPFRIRKKDGEERWLKAVWAPIADSSGDISGVLGMESDCTAEQEALRRLQESEEWNRALVNSLQSMVVVVDLEGRIRMANPYCEYLLGIESELLEGQRLARWIYPEDQPAFYRHFGAVKRGSLVREAIRYRLVREDGSVKIVEARWSLLHKDDEIAGLLLVGTDVTARVEAEKALEASEQRFRALFENVPEAVFVFDPETFRILDVNQVAVERYGWTKEELRSMTVLDIRPPEQVEIARKIIQNGKPESAAEVPGEFYHQKKDGTVFPVAIYRKILELEGKRLVVAIAVDLTDRKRAEEERERLRQQLFHAQRMESIGALAGGVAHDFNNMLTGIMGLADLISRSTAPGEVGHDEAEEIKKICRRAADLVSKLLAFSKRQIIAPKPLSLNDVVRDMGSLLRQVIGENIELVLDLDGAIPAAHADQARVEQVILNLAVNARDAMPEGGTLTIRTYAADFSQDAVNNRPGAKPGSYVVLEVSDTGRGMDEETKARIFEPFFSTKGRDQGSGLGMAVVYGIVEQHGGFIEVESSPGAGSTFRTYWPASESEPVSRKAETATGIARGSETVLVVEDEEVVRALSVRVLRRLGYRVLEARDAQEALRILESEGGVDLVFTDVVMPGMSGTELYERVRNIRPQTRFLFSSGYTTDGVHENFVLAEGVNFLAKPYDPEQLAGKIREVLDKKD